MLYPPPRLRPNCEIPIFKYFYHNSCFINKLFSFLTFAHFSIFETMLSRNPPISVRQNMSEIYFAHPPEDSWKESLYNFTRKDFFLGFQERFLSEGSKKDFVRYFQKISECRNIRISKCQHMGYFNICRKRQIMKISVYRIIGISEYQKIRILEYQNIRISEYSDISRQCRNMGL